MRALTVEDVGSDRPDEAFDPLVAGADDFIAKGSCSICSRSYGGAAGRKGLA